MRVLERLGGAAAANALLAASPREPGYISYLSLGTFSTKSLAGDFQETDPDQVSTDAAASLSSARFLARGLLNTQSFHAPPEVSSVRIVCDIFSSMDSEAPKNRGEQSFARREIELSNKCFFIAATIYTSPSASRHAPEERPSQSAQLRPA